MAQKSLEDFTVDELRAAAQQWQGSHQIITALAQNPATREVMQRAIKTVAPNVPIPEFDAKESIRAEIKAERDERIKLEQKILERDVRERLEKQRAGVIRAHNLTEADVLEVEKLMVDPENPIPTYDAAARVYKASRTPSTPTPASFVPPTFSMPEKDVWGKGIGNKAALDRIATDQAYEAWSELMSGKVAGAGSARVN